MATGIEGLFNLQTPQQMRQEFINSQMLSPSQMAQLPLLSQVAAIGGQSGAMLGAGIGGLLGAKAPGESQAEAVRGVMKNVSGTTQSERMASIAEQLSNIPGMEGQAMAAAQQAASLRAAEAKAAQDAAVANATITDKMQPKKVGINEQGQVVYAKPDGRGGFSEIVQSTDEVGGTSWVPNTSRIVGEASLTKTPKLTKVGYSDKKDVVYSLQKPDGTMQQVIAVTDAQGNQTFKPYTGKVQSGDGLNLDLPGLVSTTMAKATGMAEGKTNIEEWQKSGERYHGNVAMLEKTREMREVAGNAITGSLAEPRLQFAKLLNTLGVSGDTQAMTDTEMLEALSSQYVQTIAKTFPGSQSNKELEQLLKSKPNIKQQLPTILKLLDNIEVEMTADTATYELFAKQNKIPTKAEYNLAYGKNYKASKELSRLQETITKNNMTATDAQMKRGMELRKQLGLVD